MNIKEDGGCLPETETVVDVISQGKAEDIFRVSDAGKIDRGRILRRFFKGLQIKIKNPVEVVQFVLVWIFLKVSLFIRGHRSQVMDIKRAEFIHTGVNKELLAVTFLLERLSTMGTFQDQFIKICSIRVESRLADFTVGLCLLNCHRYTRMERHKWDRPYQAVAGTDFFF